MLALKNFAAYLSFLAFADSSLHSYKKLFIGIRIDFTLLPKDLNVSHRIR